MEEEKKEKRKRQKRKPPEPGEQYGRLTVLYKCDYDYVVPKGGIYVLSF